MALKGYALNAEQNINEYTNPNLKNRLLRMLFW